MAADPLNAQPEDGVDEFLQEALSRKPEESCNTSRWLGEIGVDIRSLATTIRHTASGVVTFVHRSALTVAEEIARLEEEEDDEEVENGKEHRSYPQRFSTERHEETSSGRNKDSVSLRLPWELLRPNHDSESCIKETFVEDAELKRRILLLSHDEASFLQPHRQVLEEDEALDASRINLIQRLLRADPFLSIAHKNLQSSISEATFWCNYFESCSAVRQKYLQDQLEALGNDQNNSDCDNDEEEEEEEEDGSFVYIDSSVKSIRSTGMRSVDSLVLVESRFANSMKA